MCDMFVLTVPHNIIVHDFSQLNDSFLLLRLKHHKHQTEDIYLKRSDSLANLIGNMRVKQPEMI